MIYIIGIGSTIIVALFIWAKIERSGKLKARRLEEVAVQNSIVAEERLEKIKDNVDMVLDYNNKNIEVNRDVNNSIEMLKMAKSNKEVQHELENIRASVYNAISTL